MEHLKTLTRVLLEMGKFTLTYITKLVIGKKLLFHETRVACAKGKVWTRRRPSHLSFAMEVSSVIQQVPTQNWRGICVDLLRLAPQMFVAALLCCALALLTLHAKF